MSTSPSQIIAWGLSGIPPTAGVATVALVLAATGLGLLIFGWRAYRVLLVACGVVAVGFAAAWMIEGTGTLAMLGVGIPVGVFGGLLTNRFERYGVFLLGGAASATLILFHSDYFMSDHTMYFSAVICFLLTGSLATLFWKPGIILSMCLLGAALVERGTLIFLNVLKPGLALRIGARHNLTLTIAFLGLVLLGIVVQYREDPEGVPEEG